MHLHLHLRHWLIWWFLVGLVLGLIAALNILERHLIKSQDVPLAIFFGVFWLLSGVVCYAIEDAESRRPHR